MPLKKTQTRRSKKNTLEKVVGLAEAMELHDVSKRIAEVTQACLVLEKHNYYTQYIGQLKFTVKNGKKGAKQVLTAQEVLDLLQRVEKKAERAIRKRNKKDKEEES